MEVTGRVIDENGAPVSRARVRVFEGETKIGEVASSPDGGFEFSNEADYTGSRLKVVVIKGGFQRLEREIAPQGETELPLVLEAEKVEVPNVVNKSYSEALVELRKQSLSGVENKTLGGPPWDTVVSQSPAAGRLVNSGDSVTLDVRVAPPKVTVPNVTNKPSREALGELSKKNLKGEVTATAGWPPWDIVVSQTPPPEQVVDPETTVRLKIRKLSVLLVMIPGCLIIGLWQLWQLVQPPRDLDFGKLTRLLLLLAIGLFFLSLPGIIATSRKRHNAVAIWLLTIFLGLTFVEWVVMMVWAWSTIRQPAGAMGLLTIFLGLTLVGWVVALVWASTTPAPQQRIVNNNRV